MNMFNGIPLANGKIPLITIQSKPEGQEALTTHSKLIQKFKKELVSGTFDLILLVDSFKGFIKAQGSRGEDIDIKNFYREYNSLVILKNVAPSVALKKLVPTPPKTTKDNSGRRYSIKYSKEEAEALRAQFKDD
jgi:hypothetical protein